MTPFFLQISRSLSRSSANSTTKTMLRHLHLPKTSITFAQNLPTPQTLQHAMSPSFPMSLTNWKNISRSSARISRNAIHLDGGGANGRIGLTCTVLRVISFVSQVCSFSYPYHSSVYAFFRL